MGKHFMKSWPRIKRMMKEYFLPANYQQQLCFKYHNCKQMNFSVDEYTKDFYLLHTRNNMDELEFLTVAKYISSLRQEI